MSKWSDILKVAEVTGRDKVVALHDPHMPPAAWASLYTEASRQNEYLETLERERLEFVRRTEETATAARLELVQRDAAIMDAKRTLDELHDRIITMAGNVGIVIDKGESDVQ